ncbi:non-ribosomal peptide synthetase, partial [Flavobacterium sp. H122]|uniref:non-ribosomal peptide synthetase n=1 Tax=Flavobacterium sp. H122 TaxID=2529860 RepID=UPI0010AABED6
RISYIEEDTNAKVVIDSSFMSEFEKICHELPNDNLEIITNPDSIAYVIYTSGTTGQPKGVIIENKNVVRLFFTDKPLFDFNENDVWTFFHSYAFDFSVWEMYGALLFGGKVIVVPKLITRNTSEFLELIHEKNVTVLNQTPSAFYNLISHEMDKEPRKYDLRYVIFGGEALNPSLLEGWNNRYPNVNLINMYGITETTVHVTYKEITEKEIKQERSNIGKPIPTLKCYVLDANRKPVPVGIFGELFVTGEGVARGYLNKPELTNERFVQNPFGEGRMYVTGDLARLLPDGNLEYFGRKDLQVKIRGFRIELGDIETQISQFENIKQIVVEVKQINSDKNLVAYYTSEVEVDKSELKQYLKSKLPEHMIPMFFVQLDSIPLTSNGKVNRKALPAVMGEDLIRKMYVGPTNETERKVVEIWQEILGIDKIGIEDDFFELGGDSIKSIRALSRINKELGVNYRLQDIYVKKTIKELASLQVVRTESEISSEIIEKVNSNFKDLQAELSDDSTIKEIFPMSDIELGMMYESLLKSDTGVYHDQFLLPVPFTSFDLKTFERAVDLMVEKHEILRTAYNINDYSEPVHLVYSRQFEEIKYEDIAAIDEEVQRRHINDFMSSERNENPFQMEHAGLWRMKIYKTANEKWLLLMQCHHAILDGWSVASFITELNNTYLLLLKNEIQSLNKLSVTYKDYVFNQKCTKEDNSKFSYWSEKLTGYHRLDLFTDRDFYKQYTYQLEGELFSGLQKFSKENNISLKDICFAAYLNTLQLISFEKDIVVGLVTNGRPLAEDGDKILGCFLNTLPFRSQYEKNSSSKFVKKISENLTIQKEYEGISMFELHNRFSTDNKGQNPFFDVIYNYVDFHVFEELNSEIEENLHESTDFVDEYAVTNTFMDINVRPVADKGLRISWMQQKEFRGTIQLEQLQLYFNNFLMSLVNQPELLLSNDLIITDEEKHQLLVDFNDTKVEYPSHKTIIEIFEDQVEKTPRNIAVVFKDIQLNYQELNEKANQLSQFLIQKYNVLTSDFVGIKLDRSENVIVSILAVLKAGGAYVPIDVSYPKERIDFIEKDSKCRLIIDDVLLESFVEESKFYSNGNFSKEILPESLAYIIYTSGTTGNPKGVMVENKSVINLITYQTNHFGIDASERILQFSNYAFDASVEQIFLALLNGASLHLISKDVLIEQDALDTFLYENQITHFHAVPSVVQMVLPDKKYALKRVIAGGDHCPQQLAASWGKVCKFYNEYGPTETTVTSIEYLFNPEMSFSIGKPIGNTQVYILDINQEIIPVGTVGKIYIAGDGLTRGYLNRPELTSEKFINNPFNPGERMYDTGDLGRWLPDGNIEFLGRDDHQVKIRGYRIELEEIEKALIQFENQIQNCVVEAKKIHGENLLVAYYTSEIEVDKSLVKAFLHDKLPDFMVPSFFVQLDNLPVTANGKIDRKALPSVGNEDMLKKEHVEPRNESEEMMVEIWKNILRLDKLGVTDNFFDLGGHSLIATKLINQIHKEFNVKLTVNQLFDNQTIEDLVQVIESIKYFNENIEEREEIETENFSL